MQFAIGFLTFLAAHFVERATWRAWFHGDFEPWFLNSGRAIAFTVACLMVASAADAAITRSARRESGLLVAAGAFTAMAGVLFFKEGGPGTIFPLVLVAGGACILFSSVAGAWLGAAISRRIRFQR